MPNGDWDEFFGIKKVKTKTMPDKEHPIRTNKLINELAWYRKDILMQLLGGKCKRCGNIYPQRAMDFHHIDGKEKDELSVGRRLRGYSEKAFWEGPLPDVVKKCMLLCASCHRIEHK